MKFDEFFRFYGYFRGQVYSLEKLFHTVVNVSISIEKNVFKFRIYLSLTRLI